MRIGYPCINTTIGCKSNRAFRLKSYSEKRLVETLKGNISCLAKILSFNIKHNLLFFRIASNLVPFASHTVCRFNWQRHFEEKFRAIGVLIKNNSVRISMHPDQFVVLNSLDNEVFENSVKELVYNAQVLDLMKLDNSAKIQIHVGGVYKDKNKSIKRFVERFNKLDDDVKRRIVLENDDRSFNLRDCLYISAKTEIPILFDVFHHEVNSSGETTKEAFALFTKTWKKEDGLPMVDYSSQKEGQRIGKHVQTINLKHFGKFLDISRPYDFDVMLEIKNKEKSALEAVKIASQDPRLMVATSCRC